MIIVWGILVLLVVTAILVNVGAIFYFTLPLSEPPDPVEPLLTVGPTPFAGIVLVLCFLMLARIVRRLDREHAARRAALKGGDE